MVTSRKTSANFCRPKLAHLPGHGSRWIWRVQSTSHMWDRLQNDTGMSWGSSSVCTNCSICLKYGVGDRDFSLCWFSFYRCGQRLAVTCTAQWRISDCRLGQNKKRIPTYGTPSAVANTIFRGVCPSAKKRRESLAQQGFLFVFAFNNTCFWLRESHTRAP